MASDGSLAPAAPRGSGREDAAAARRPATHAERRGKRFRLEIAARTAVAVLALGFTAVVAFDHEAASVIRVTALIALGVNLPYLLAVHSGRAVRTQAFVRILVDVALITGGLYGAGGLGAAPYLGVYAIVPVYAAIVFSSLACVLAVLFATASYLVLASLQSAGVVPVLAPPPPGAWTMAAFNLLILNIVGGLAALLAHAYRASRTRLAALSAELERAHDHSVQMNTQLQLATRRYVLGEVVTGVTHEVRDALQGVFGHLWLARRGGPPLPAPALDHLAQAEQACENAMRIMSTTLDVARRPAPEQEAVAVAEVVRRVAEQKAVEFRRERMVVAGSALVAEGGARRTAAGRPRRDAPAPAGAAQPGRQRAGGATRCGRAAGDHHRRPPGRRPGDPRRARQRPGHPAQRPAPPLRAVLHDEDGRHRDRAGDVGRHRREPGRYADRRESPRGRRCIPPHGARRSSPVRTLRSRRRVIGRSSAP